MLKDVDVVLPAHEVGFCNIPLQIAGFLADPRQFKCDEARRVMHGLERDVEDGLIFFAVDPEIDAPKYNGYFPQYDPNAMIWFPPNFLKKIEENPLWQIGALIYSASLAKDHVRGRLNKKSRKKAHNRVEAFIKKAEKVGLASLMNLLVDSEGLEPSTSRM